MSGLQVEMELSGKKIRVTSIRDNDGMELDTLKVVVFPGNTRRFIYCSSISIRVFAKLLGKLLVRSHLRELRWRGFD